MPALTLAVTVTAYLAVVLLVAGLFGPPGGSGGPGAESDPERGTPRLTAIRRAAACVIVLAGFLFVPPGSLPPLCDIPWGGAAFLACIFAGRVLCGGFRLVPAAVLAAVFLVLVRYGWQRGVPGNPGNLSTYAAMPVWRLAEGMDVVAFLCLALAFLLAAGPMVLPDAKAMNAETMAGRLIRLAVCAFFVTLFLPWNAAPFVSWPVTITAGFDFVLFWVKCAVVMFCVAKAGTIPRAAPASALCFLLSAVFLVPHLV